MRTINHFGVPVTTPVEGEMYNEVGKFFFTDFTKSANKIEFLRFEEGCQMHELIQTKPHVAYEVESLAQELVGAEIIMAPFVINESLTIAFVVEEGLPIELMQFK